jgi:hypothetical protein
MIVGLGTAWKPDRSASSVTRPWRPSTTDLLSVHARAMVPHPDGIWKAVATSSTIDPAMVAPHQRPLEQECQERCRHTVHPRLLDGVEGKECSLFQGGSSHGAGAPHRHQGGSGAVDQGGSKQTRRPSVGGVACCLPRVSCPM